MDLTSLLTRLNIHDVEPESETRETDEKDEDSELTNTSSTTFSTSEDSLDEVFSFCEELDEDPLMESPRWLLDPQAATHEGKMTVVLDMDETLLHSEFLNGEDYHFRQEETSRHTAENNGPDFILDVCDGVAVHLRPWVSEFLSQLSKHFEVGIFTAAEEAYAGPVLDKIDPTGCLSFRLYRESTVNFQGVPFVKDLSRLGRDLRRTVLIDNNVQATLASPDNSLMIEDYFGDNADCELPRMLWLLKHLSELDDVRPLLRSRYNDKGYDWTLEELDNIDVDVLLR